MRNRTLIVAGLTLVANGAFAGVDIIGYSIQSNGNQHLYEINFSTNLATDMGLVTFADGEGMAMDLASTMYAIGGTVTNCGTLRPRPAL